MDNLNIGLLILIGILALESFAHSRTILKLVNQLAEVNKQLLILVAGREGKPEQAGATMRALVASSKPPQGKLRGIAEKKKKDDKLKNTDYVMELGT